MSYTIRRLHWSGAVPLVELSYPVTDIPSVDGAYVKVSGTVSAGDLEIIDRDQIKRDLVGQGARGVRINLTSERMAIDTLPSCAIPTEIPDPHATLSGLLEETFPDGFRRGLAQGILDRHYS